MWQQIKSAAAPTTTAWQLAHFGVSCSVARRRLAGERPPRSEKLKSDLVTVRKVEKVNSVVFDCVLRQPDANYCVGFQLWQLQLLRVSLQMQDYFILKLTLLLQLQTSASSPEGALLYRAYRTEISKKLFGQLCTNCRMEKGRDCGFVSCNVGRAR